MTPPTTLADFTGHERARIGLCWHEAAHAVAGVILGGQLDRATVTDGERRGGVIERPKGATTFTALPGRHTDVAFAGPWGEARGRLRRRPTPGEVSSVMAGSGRHDHDALCAAGGPVVDAKVVPLLERCWESVAVVAAQLFQTGAVTHAEVCSALGIPPADNGVELSMIRSGCAPGSFSVTRPGQNLEVCPHCGAQDRKCRCQGR